jgi:hypothetical protein
MIYLLFYQLTAGNHLSTAMAGTDFGFSPRAGVVDISMDGSFMGKTCVTPNPWLVPAIS